MFTKLHSGAVSYKNGDNFLLFESYDKFLAEMKKIEKETKNLFNPSKTKDKTTTAILKALCNAASKDAAKTILTGVYYDHDKKKVAATDGYRLAVLETDMECESGIYPAKPFKKTGSLSGNIEGKYPDYERIIPKTFDEKVKVKINSGQVIKCLKSWLKQTQIEGDRSLIVSFRDGQLWGNHLKSPICDFPLDIEHQFNGAYFADMLEFMGNDFEVGLNSIVQAVLFTKDKQQYMLMPIKP